MALIAGCPADLGALTNRRGVFQQARLLWDPNRGDNFTTATAQGEQDALAAGYFFIRNEVCMGRSPVRGSAWAPDRSCSRPCSDCSLFCSVCSAPPSGNAATW
jgi:hypothetical protein